MIAGKIIKEWDRGDGGCKMLKDNLCSIYNERPDICRVKDYLKENELNKACNFLREMRR